MQPLPMFFTGLVSAITMKLISSVDDVLWLAPFLTTSVSLKMRVQNALVYVGVCLLQTVVAMAIAASGNATVAWLTKNDKHAWSADKILTVSAGVLLAVYTVKLTYEYMYEDAEEDDESGDSDEEDSETSTGLESKESDVLSEMELGAVDKDSITYDAKDSSPSRSASMPLVADGREFDGSRCILKDSDQADLPRHISGYQSPTEKPGARRGEEKKQRALFVIAFIGSIDDLTLFVPMLAGKGIDFLQLISGATIAACSIVMICLFLGLCKPIAKCLSSIPLALIVAGFSITLLCKGFLIQ